jgi:hypothetical protein
MRKVFFVAAFISVFSCSTKTQVTDPVSNPLDSPALPTREAQEVQADSYPIEFDSSSIYIGLVSYFPETKEFYTSLYSGYTNPDHDAMYEKLDSVIVSSEELRRERVPMEDARKHFLLQGLDTILIYSSKHRFVSEAVLVRVEYFEEIIDGGYIAVFKAADREVTDTEFYGVTARKKTVDYRDFYTEQLEDERLTDIVIQKLGKDTSGMYVGWHVRVMPMNTIYSAISNDNESFLSEMNKDGAVILKQMEEDELLTGFLPLPYAQNGKPLFLMHASVRESDMSWEFLAGFDGKNFSDVKFGRIPQ